MSTIAALVSLHSLPELAYAEDEVAEILAVEGGFVAGSVLIHRVSVRVMRLTDA